MRNILRLAVRDLTSDPLRTLFSVVGIAVVLTAVLLLNAMAFGLSDFLDTAPISTNLIILDSSFLDPSDSLIPDHLSASLLNWTPAPIQLISPVFYRQMRVDERVVQLRAAPPDHWQPVYHMLLVEGRWPDAPDEIVVGEGAARGYGWQLGQQLIIYGESFTVSGIFRAPGTGFSALWMLPEAAQQLFGAGYSIQVLTLMLAPGVDPSLVRDELEGSQLLAGQFSVFLEDQYTRRNGQLARDLYHLLTVIGMLGMLAVPLSSYCLTLLNLAERSRALAVLRAVGFTNQAVYAFSVSRTLLVAFAAYLLGLLGAGAFIAARQAQGTIFVIGFPFAFTLTHMHALVFLTITLVFSLFGAWFSGRRVLHMSILDLITD